ncbi:D-alanine--D-alanyl carrier protein ligase [Streptomyces alboniger]
MRMLTLGGATEASIHSTIYEVEEADPEWASIPYGRPLANQRTYILDDAFQPVPPGVTGELYLAGTGVARGYLDQPERTAERFIDWTHGEVSDRIYRTGDMARFGADGLIELLGRRDFQVKLNGLRVELGEIEAVLRSHPAVQQSAVVAHRNQLVAYAVAADGEIDVDALHRIAADRLPQYMVPEVIMPLDRLPLTPNGKVDRKSCPNPTWAEPTTARRAPSRRRSWPPPPTPTSCAWHASASTTTSSPWAATASAPSRSSPGPGPTASPSPPARSCSCAPSPASPGPPPTRRTPRRTPPRPCSASASRTSRPCGSAIRG